jgi:hypothetical protein
VAGTLSAKADVCISCNFACSKRLLPAIEFGQNLLEVGRHVLREQTFARLARPECSDAREAAVGIFCASGIGNLLDFSSTRNFDDSTEVQYVVYGGRMALAPLAPLTKQFLQYLQKHPDVRSQIRAKRNETILFSGRMFKPAKDELRELKKMLPEMASKEMLPDVLGRIVVADSGYASLLEYAETVQNQVPWFEDGYTLWRALSGIYASNAEGRVSFYIGSEVSREQRKIFVVTEISVLERNPNVDALTRDVLAYYLRCIKNKQHSMNFSFIGGVGQI